MLLLLNWRSWRLPNRAYSLTSQGYHSNQRPLSDQAINIRKNHVHGRQWLGFKSGLRDRISENEISEMRLHGPKIANEVAETILTVMLVSAIWCLPRKCRGNAGEANWLISS